MAENQPAVVEVEQVNIMRLQPGDVIVATAKEVLEPVERYKIIRFLRKKFPGYECVCLDPTLTLEIARPEQAKAE